MRTFSRLVRNAAAAALMLAGGTMPADAGRVRGEVYYREKVALPPDATLEVSLYDVSRPGEYGDLIAAVQIRPRGPSPIPFEIFFGDDTVGPDRAYGLRARIVVAGKLLFVSAETPRVLTRGASNTARILMLGISIEEPVSAGAATALTGVLWRADEIGGRGVLADVEMTFSVGTGGTVAGSGGCNAIRGTAEIAQSDIDFSLLGATRKTCASAVMEQETKFLSALAASRTFRIDGEHLELRGAEGAVLVRLQPVR